MPAQRPHVVSLLTLIAVVTAGPHAYSQTSLRYQPKLNSSFAYEMEISVELPDTISQFKGTARYTVAAVDDDQIRLMYAGGLPQTTKAKSTSTDFGRPPFGPRFGPFGPGGPPHPFSRPTFGGVMQATNHITMTSRGAILALKGESQLPYLLGHAALLPFEILPADNEQQWKYDTGISVEQKNENRDGPFGPFGPGRFGPFAQQDDSQTQVGRESAEYAVQKEQDGMVAVKKTYHLRTPRVGDDPAFEMTGGGIWIYNAQEKIPESAELKYKLVISESQTQTTIPITLSMRRMSAAALAKLDEAAQARAKEIQQRMQEAKEKAEAAKREAAAPLTAEEKSRTLEALRGSDAARLEETLAFLKGKTPAEPDSEIAAAIEPHLAHATEKIKTEATAALRKWSPEFDRRFKLNEAYAKHMPVESTDRPVESTTPLYPGQILQFQEHGVVWFAGEVLELLPDGKVRIRKRGFAPREYTLARRNLQLAPDEVDQPQRPATSPNPFEPATARVWTDASGEHRIEATYLGFADGNVQLKRTDGKEIAVPLDKLSAADQQIVKQLQTAKKKTPNPFE